MKRSNYKIIDKSTIDTTQKYATKIYLFIVMCGDREVGRSSSQVEAEKIITKDIQKENSRQEILSKSQKSEKTEEREDDPANDGGSSGGPKLGG